MSRKWRRSRNLDWELILSYSPHIRKTSIQNLKIKFISARSWKTIIRGKRTTWSHLKISSIRHRHIQPCHFSIKIHNSSLVLAKTLFFPHNLLVKNLKKLLASALIFKSLRNWMKTVEKSNRFLTISMKKTIFSRPELMIRSSKPRKWRTGWA